MTSAAVTPILSDFTAARDVQQRFMQHRGPEIDAISYSARCRQLSELGGDCYDLAPVSGDRVAVAVADACGKGLAAALMISSLQSALRTAVQFTGEDLGATLRVVNRQVHGSSLEARFVTLFFGIFSPATRTLQYVNAGHNPPLVLRRDGTVAWLQAGGIPLGLFPDSSYATGAIQLGLGDLLVAYTDGVTEATNYLGQEWGAEGLRRATAENRAKSPAEIVDAVFAGMDRFSGGHQSDDATVVVLRAD